MRRTIVLLALFAMMTAFGASKAHAVLLTYSYTGNNFTEARAPFTTSDRITGSFNIDCGALGGGGDCSSLPPADYAHAVTSWSFTVAGFTLIGTDPRGFPGPQFYMSRFSTDSEALPTFWEGISADNGLNLPLLPEIIITLNSNLVFKDQVLYQTPGGGSSGAINDLTPGRWTVSEVSVPEPSTLANALVSLAALLLLLWRLRALPVREHGRPLAPQMES